MVISCGPPPLKGTYVGHIAVNRDPRMSEGELNTLGKIKLMMPGDGTFTLQESGIPKQGEVETTASGATLHVKKILSRSAALGAEEPTIRLTKGAGDTLILVDSSTGISAELKPESN